MEGLILGNLQIENSCCLFVTKKGHFQSKANTVVILIKIEIIFTQRLFTLKQRLVETWKWLINSNRKN